MQEKREKTNRHSEDTRITRQEERGGAPLSAAKKRGSKKKASNGRWDTGKTIKLLYGVALLLAVAAVVLIGIKMFEDLSAGNNANKLLSAYKGMATVEPSTVTPTPAPSADQSAEPSPSPTPDNEAAAADAEAHRLDDGSDEGVDEVANYVPPEEPENAETEALIAKILASAGDDGVIGILTIPSTEQELPIIGKWSYSLLKISICRYQGPEVNQPGNLVLIGHNYKSGAHFGNLKNLEVGDEIFLQKDLHSEKVRYEVYDIEVVAPDAFSALKPYEGDCGLTLMTCTNNGNSRRILRCVQKAAEVVA